MLEEFFSSGALCSLNSNELLVGWGQAFWSRQPVCYPVWYAPDFFLISKRPYVHFKHSMRIRTDQMIAKLGNIFRPEMHFSSPKWEAFEALFHQFKSSSIQKLVPYTVKEAAFKMSSLNAMLASALVYQIKNPRTAVYGLWGEGQGILGATPERLFSLKDNGSLMTTACAGTSLAHEAKMMIKNTKLMQEHQYVIDGIKKSLSPFGEVNIGRTEAQVFSHLAHLLTPIEVYNIASHSFAKLVRHLHPTPAVGGFPKEEGMDYLKTYAVLVPRERFGAPFGFLETANEAHLYVAIRNIQWKGERAALMAGSGIVLESDLEKEKQEIKSKFAAIEEILGL